MILITGRPSCHASAGDYAVSFGDPRLGRPLKAASEGRKHGHPLKPPSPGRHMSQGRFDDAEAAHRATEMPTARAQQQREDLQVMTSGKAP